MSQEYFTQLSVAASPDEAFPAVATVAGIRRWWTPIVAGVSERGGSLTLGFEGLDEAIFLRVDEVRSPARVTWTCLRHTSAPAWDGSRITFDVEDRPGGSELRLRHMGVHEGLVAAGWQRFLDSLARLLATGTGRPYTARNDSLPVARAYYAAWTSGDHAGARRLLADDLVADVPINEYSGGDDFAAAVARFGGLAERVELLAEFSGGDEALLLYDMHIGPLGVFRVAEHLTVGDGLIRRIRQVHDTAVLRESA